VEFPNSNIKLNGLPRSHFPIHPVKIDANTIVMLSGKRDSLPIKREQLPLQLAFASTVHGAQGRTIPSIVSDLNFGGAKAYVIASRTRSRHTLALIRPTTLKKLNTRRTPDLEKEACRLRDLEHNTRIRYDFSIGNEVEVYDPEAGNKDAEPDKVTWEITERKARGSAGSHQSPRKRKVYGERASEQRDAELSA